MLHPTDALLNPLQAGAMSRTCAAAVAAVADVKQAACGGWTWWWTVGTRTPCLLSPLQRCVSPRWQQDQPQSMLCDEKHLQNHGRQQHT